MGRTRQGHARRFSACRWRRQETSRQAHRSAPQGHGIEESDPQLTHLLQRFCPDINIRLVKGEGAISLSALGAQMDRLDADSPWHQTLRRNDDDWLSLVGLIPEGTEWAVPQPA